MGTGGQPAGTGWGSYPPPAENPPAPPGYPPPSYPPAPGYPPPGYPPPGYPPPGYPPPGYPPGTGGPYGPPAAGTGTYASWGIRVGAYVIDVIIVWIVSTVVSLPLRSSSVLQFHFWVDTSTKNVRHYYHGSGLGFVVLFVLSVAYGTLFCGSSLGRTPGMMAVNLRVVRAATGGPIGFGAALGRALLQWVFFALFFLPWLLDMAFPLWDSRRQTLHDKIAGTVVLRN